MLGRPSALQANLSGSRTNCAAPTGKSPNTEGITVMLQTPMAWRACVKQQDSPMHRLPQKHAAQPPDITSFQGTSRTSTAGQQMPANTVCWQSTRPTKPHAPHTYHVQPQKRPLSRTQKMWRARSKPRGCGTRAAAQDPQKSWQTSP